MFQDSRHLPSCCRGVVTSPLSPPLVGKLTARDAGTSRSIASADLLVAANRLGTTAPGAIRRTGSPSAAPAAIPMFHPRAAVFPDVRIRSGKLGLSHLV
jgi:hypothetical protein